MIQDNEKIVSQREREINDIVKSINGLATVFKELNTMVIDQGSILDRIDYNLESTNVNLEAAHEELKKADKYQSGSRTKILIIILLLLVVFLSIFVGYKLAFRKRSVPVTAPSSG